jgi:predicted CoA-binding protein
MSFRNPAPQAIADLLRQARTIAVVGLSDEPSRPSYGVSCSMREYGYRILPVNPALQQWLGQPVHASLAAAQQSLEPGARIDVVNVFRRPARVGEVVDECLQLGLPALWLQQGVINEPEAVRAAAAGMFVVMDRCIYVDRAALPA